MDNFNIAFLVITIIFFMLSLWLMDVSVSGLLIGGKMYSVFNVPLEPIVTYHVALISSCVIFAIVISTLMVEIEALNRNLSRALYKIQSEKPQQSDTANND
jgi:hypothetical protein